MKVAQVFFTAKENDSLVIKELIKLELYSLVVSHTTF